MEKEKFLRENALIGERWAEIDYGKGRYFVSTSGRVASFCKQTPKFLKPVPCISRNKFYNCLCLSIDGVQKKFRVFNLVAKAFLPNPKNLREVDHINGDSLDDRVENLRWVSHAENMRNPETMKRLKESHRIQKPWYTRVPGTNPKTKKPVVRISRDGDVVVYPGIVDAVRDGFAYSGIFEVCRGRSETYRKFQWMYLKDYEKMKKEQQ